MIYTCNNFDGHWPVGSAAVVRAECPEEAAILLSTELKRLGLKQIVNPDQMKLMCNEAVIILCDGNY